MMKVLKISLLFLFLVNQLFSQKLIIPEMKMYEDSTGTLFIQKDLPVYLMVGTSPDDKSKSMVLKSKRTPQYSNPLYLDAEGFNSFRTPSAVDKVTRKPIIPKQDIFFEIYADSKSPVTTISFGKGQSINRGKIIHVNGNAEVTLTSKDELSGVDKILFSIDSADYREYTGSFKLDNEKRYIIKYYAFDHVGNVEAVKSVSIMVDRTKPKTTMLIKGNASDNVLSGNSSIVLKPESDSSGIVKLMVRLDKGQEYAYSGPINMATLASGDHQLIYYAVDNVGNKEESNEYHFFIDRTPPIILQDIVGKNFMVNGKEYSSGSSMLKLTALDNKAGVKEIYYAINNGNYKLYEKPVVLTTIKGDLKISSYAVDNVGNESTSKDDAKAAKASYIDITGPVLSHNFAGPVFALSDTTYISNKTKIGLKAFDQESGLNNIQYRIDNEELKPFDNTFIIDKEGLHSVEYIGADNVDNTSVNSFRIIVDNSGPEIYPRFSAPSKSNENQNGKSIDIYSGHVVLFVAATDLGAGYDHMTYSLNGSDEHVFTGIINGFTKHNEVTIKAYDKLGNERTTSVEFLIGE